MQTGDSATWVSAVGTVGALAVALWQISRERTARHDREQREAIERRRSQAEHVSAWIGREGPHESEVWVLNDSGQPVFEVVASIVAFLGSGPQDGRDTPPDFRAFLSIAPPGRHRMAIQGGYRGMHFEPAIEVAFIDRAGRYWVRSGDGMLAEIEGQPVEYYDLPSPLSWNLPEPV